MSHLLCAKCFGSGWEDIKNFPINAVRRFNVLVPCAQCKGKGRIEITDTGEIKPIPDPKIQKGDDQW